MKMFRNKKGMEIAVTTLVGMILGALMLFAGIALLANVMLKVDKSHDQITEQMEQEIIRAFDSNDPIFIYRNPLSPNRKDTDVAFGIGIHNIYNTSREFNISVEPNAALKNILSANNLQVGYFDEPFSIAPRQKHALFVIVPVSKLESSEQYSLTLRVTYKNENNEFVTHDRPRILYVNN